MNNLVHLKQSDPIFDEYEAFVDKGAGIKTIAFKYFGADIQIASEYLALNKIEIIDEPVSKPIPLMQVEYYQPELLH